MLRFIKNDATSIEQNRRGLHFKGRITTTQSVEFQDLTVCGSFDLTLVQFAGSVENLLFTLGKAFDTLVGNLLENAVYLSLQI